MAADLLDLDALPDRIRKNLTVMIFGFSQFMRFGIKHGCVDETEDWTDSLKNPASTVKTTLCGEDGVTKVSLDYLVQHLATMAETGRLKLGQDYVIRETYNDIAIRFDSCFAEYRKYHRETQLDGELLNAQAYRRQIKENYDRGGYIQETNVAVKFRGTNKKALIIKPTPAESPGIDTEGFFGNEEDTKAK